MTDYNIALKKYTSANHTQSKLRQTILLYEAAIRYVSLAKTSITNNNINERYNLLEKANSIVTGLQSALDFQKGGNVAILLEDFYFSMSMRITNIQLSNDLDMCDIVINELKIMCDSWKYIDDNNGSKPDVIDNKNVKFDV